MRTTGEILGALAAAAAGSPALGLAHPGHGAAATMHLHGWEVAGFALAAVLVVTAITTLARDREGDDG